MEWLVNEWFPLSHKICRVGIEDDGKTILDCWLRVCVATGNSFFGQKVTQGNILVIDEETPLADLERHLNRFSQHFGYKDYKSLPQKITIRHETGFKFDRRECLDKVIDDIKYYSPILITFDSLASMFPIGRKGLNENSSDLGMVLHDDMKEIMGGLKRCTSLAVHARKQMAERSVEDWSKLHVTDIVRGHGSIVGDGCDTAVCVKRLSEKPYRAAIIMKARRGATYQKPLYVELKEKTYRIGSASLEIISEPIPDPSNEDKTLYNYIRDGKEYKSKDILREVQSISSYNCRQSLQRLFKNGVIVRTLPETFKLNSQRGLRCTKEYLDLLSKL